ncbi:MAG: hypothetical protein AB7K67_11960, partial [Hyphomicrobiaceae bacterium]
MTGIEGTAERDDAPPPPRERSAPVRSSVREVRARLAQGTSLKPEFEYELLAMFVRNEVSARVTIPLLAVVFSLTTMFWAPVLQACAWLAIVISFKFFMIAACQRFLALPPSEVHVRKWRHRLTAIAAAGGVAWGGIAIVGPGVSDPSSHVFILASL